MRLEIKFDRDDFSGFKIIIVQKLIYQSYIILTGRENMKYPLKGALCALSLIFNPLGAAADTLTLGQPNLNGTVLTEETTPETEYIDRHVVFILDRSASMDDRELSTLHESIIQAFETEEVLFNFNSGNRYAMTFISFGAYAVTSPTYIVQNPADARIAVYQALMNDNGIGYREYPQISSTTLLGAALHEMGDLFAHGENALGIESLSRTAVIIGDERPSDYYSINVLTYIEQFHVSFNCMPIIPENYERENILPVVPFYQENIMTPDDTYFYTGAYGYTHEIEGGRCDAAGTAQHGIPVIAHALRSTLG